MTDTLEQRVEKLLRAKARHASAYRDRADALEGQIEQAFREPLLAAFKALDVDPFQGGRDGDQCLWCNTDRSRDIDSQAASQRPEFHLADCEFIRVLALLDQDGERGAERSGS